MAVSEIETPRKGGAMSMPSYYRERREKGFSHDEVVADMCHVYSLHGQEGDITRWVAETRREVENPAPVEPEPEKEPEATRAPDPLDAIEADANAQILALTADRQRLSLDALDDDEAKAELNGIESRLSAAETELERIGFARAEAGRRAAEQQAKRDREARQGAERQARVLDTKARATAKQVDEAADAFAKVVAAHISAIERAAEMRSRSFAPSSDPFAGHVTGGAYTGCLHYALSARGVERAVAFAPGAGVTSGPLVKEG